MFFFSKNTIPRVFLDIINIIKSGRGYNIPTLIVIIILCLYINENLNQ